MKLTVAYSRIAANPFPITKEMLSKVQSLAKRLSASESRIQVIRQQDGTYKVEAPLYRIRVIDPIYKSKRVVHVILTYDLRTSFAGAAEESTILLNLYRLGKLTPSGGYEFQVDSDSLSELLLHELVHVFDPEVLKQRLKGQEFYDEGIKYRTQKHEDTAYLSKDLLNFRWLRQEGYSLEQVISFIKSGKYDKYISKNAPTGVELDPEMSPLQDREKWKRQRIILVKMAQDVYSGKYDNETNK